MRGHAVLLFEKIRKPLYAGSIVIHPITKSVKEEQ